jgi:hypothetical protein
MIELKNRPSYQFGQTINKCLIKLHILHKLARKFNLLLLFYATHKLNIINKNEL